MMVKKNDFLIGLILILFFCAQIVWWGGYLLIIDGIALLLWSIRKKGNIYAALFIVLLFQKGLQRLSSGAVYQVITYSDEILEVVLFLMLCCAVRGGAVNSRSETKILLSYSFWIGLTIVSSIFNGTASITTMILDCFVCIKFMVFYQGGRLLSKRNYFTSEGLYYYLNSACKIISVILLLLCIHDIFLAPFFEKFDYRYITYSLELCFLHPTYLAAVCMSCMAVLIYNMKYDPKNMRYIIMLTVVTLFTFRTKAIGALLIMFALYFSCVKYKLKTKWLLLMGATCVVVYLSLSQLETYFVAGTSVPIRLKLLQDGIRIAQQFFPFGAGFGSFGTTVAYESGSSFYYSLGYMSGFYANQPVGDAFWPGIFAPAGWVGTIFFIVAILLMVMDSIRRLKEDEYAGWCMLSILSYAIIASTAETAFFNPATAFMFIIYGIASD